MPAPTRRRREVEAVRAIAVLLVMLNHVWAGRVSGGVDVFFVLSAFVLTLSFVNRVDSGRDWSFRDTVLNRFKRLVPLMAVVLVSVLAAGALLIPPIRWRGMISQAASSITFTQNHTLAGLSVDYYATNRAGAPVLQHFWSLAIQGQVFVLWPLLFAAVLLLARFTRLGAVRLLTGVMVIIFAASLTASVVLTTADPTRTYFLTSTRLWEFAAGSLVAIVAHRYGTRLLDRLADPTRPGLRGRLGRIGAPALGWAGVAALVACGPLQPTPAHFPGLLSLWPVAAAVAVIIAGDRDRFGVAAVHRLPVAQWLAKHSFGLYLWHWPVLVLWLESFERPRATLVDGLGVLLLSGLLTWLSDKVVSGGLAVLPRRRPVVLLVSLLVVVAPVVGWNGVLGHRAAMVAAQPATDNPGAKALEPGYVDSTSPTSRIRPYDSEVETDWANLPDRCDPQSRPQGLVGENCLEYWPVGEVTKTVVVLGDSRSQQWTAALLPVARKHGWHVVSLTLHGCSFTGHRDDNAEICNDFNAEATRWTRAMAPDAVFSVATRTSEAAYLPERLEPEYEAGIAPFLADGIQVVAMRDTPRFDFDVPACVQKHGRDSERCQVPRADALAATSPLAALPATPQLARLDLTARVCPDDVCAPVIGNVYVYMDDQHLSSTYVETMAADFGTAWFDATGWQRHA
ncbi:acyltransferase family protein [Propionibacteriaceae bacterium Y2011]